MLAGRASVYDNDYYLSATCPPALASGTVLLTPTQRASMSIMHAFVQCPRLNCLVRHAILQPNDTSALAAAITLTEYLWQVDLPSHVAELIRTAVTVVDEPPSPSMADVLTKSLQFDSVQSMILCTRYWMLQNELCGLTDTLRRHFPTQTVLSLLPDLESLRTIDRNAGVCLAESLAWAETVSQSLPLVPLRLHTPLQISLGPWHRTIRYISALIESGTVLDDELNQQYSEELFQAMKMKTWLIDKCNRIHEQWDVSTVDEKSLCETLDAMAGEQIPDWLPTRVRFEAEDGDMVIKLDYDKPSGQSLKRFALGDDRATYPPNIKMAHLNNEELTTHDLRIANAGAGSTTIFGSAESTVPSGSTVYPSLSPGPADFLFKSGRNLCSTSEWWPTEDSVTNVNEDAAFVPCTEPSSWPETPKSSVVLLDSTHKASAFSPKSKLKQGPTAVTFDNRNVNGCMSPAWTNSSRSAKSSTNQ